MLAAPNPVYHPSSPLGAPYHFFRCMLSNVWCCTKLVEDFAGLEGGWVGWRRGGGGVCLPIDE